MTSSSILTTFPSTNSTFGKYSTDSMLTEFLPMQTNVSSMSLPVNTLDICCHLKALPCPHTKFKSSKIGQFHKDSRIFNHFSALPISTIISFMDILKSHSTYASYPQGYPWHFSDECHSAFEALKKAFTTALVLTHWSWTLKLQLRLTLWLCTCHCPFNYDSWWQLASYCIPLTGPFLPWNSITMSMTKSYSQYLKLSNDGDITLKALDFWLMWSLITGIWQYFSMNKILTPIDKHVGPNYLSGFNLGNLFPSWKTQNQTQCTH